MIQVFEMSSVEINALVLIQCCQYNVETRNVLFTIDIDIYKILLYNVETNNLIGV
jgi:hypothetical protein